jgi:hypothetical protein
MAQVPCIQPAWLRRRLTLWCRPHRLTLWCLADEARALTLWCSLQVNPVVPPTNINNLTAALQINAGGWATGASSRGRRSAGGGCPSQGLHCFCQSHSSL